MADLSILIIEDDKSMANTLRLLFKSKFDCETDTAENCAETREKLRSARYDIITLDYELPDGDGLDLLGEITADENHPPVIVVTGHGDEKVALEAFKKGASSYVVKDSRMSAILPASILKALESSSQRRKQKDFDVLAEKYRGIFDNSKSGIAVFEVVGDGDDFVVKDLNRAAEGIDNISRGEVVGKPVLDVLPSADRSGLLDILQRVWRTGAPEQMPVRRYLDEQTFHWRENYVYKLSTGGIVDIYEDVTELNYAEEELKERERELGKTNALLEETGRMARVGGWEFDIDTGKQVWTPEVYRIHEVDPDFEPTVEKGISFYASEAVPVMSEAVNRAIEDGEPYDLELRFITAKGNERWVHVIGRAEREGGKTVKVHGTFQDITNRKQAEEALRQTSDYLESLLGYANAPIIVWDSESKIQRFNNAFERLSGYAADEVIDRELGILFPEETRKESLGNIERTLSGEFWESVEIPVLRKDGSTRVALWNSANIYDEDGETVVATIAQGQDITERKQAEEALQHMNLELEGYAHTVSHDLRGPVSATSMALDMLLSDLEEVEMPVEKAEQLREMIEAGRRSMSNANNIIESLLAVAEAGEPQDVFTVSIEDAVDRVLEENAETIKEKGITVEIASPLGQVLASPTQIYQLFSNLIRNSIKHNRAESPLIEISSLGVDGTAHTFLVRDNGQGIPDEILDDVFTPFVKAQSIDSGIGLSIVEKIVRAYGGEIRAYNDNGACFEFTLLDWGEVGH
jgi:PAS domain S-box-containing protein